jgi:hypothetical protein
MSDELFYIYAPMTKSYFLAPGEGLTTSKAKAHKYSLAEANTQTYYNFVLIAVKPKSGFNKSYRQKRYLKQITEHSAAIHDILRLMHFHDMRRVEEITIIRTWENHPQTENEEIGTLHIEEYPL